MPFSSAAAVQQQHTAEDSKPDGSGKKVKKEKHKKESKEKKHKKHKKEKKSKAGWPPVQPAQPADVCWHAINGLCH